MKKCTKCGKEITVGPNAMKIQKDSVEYYKKTLKEKGDFLPVDTERSLKRCLYESQQVVNGDSSILGYYREGLCEKCSHEKHKNDHLPMFGISENSLMSCDELKRIKENGKRFTNAWNAEQLINKITRGW